jgi:type IV secretory pathway VirB2 component (pilin)
MKKIFIITVFFSLMIASIVPSYAIPISTCPTGVDSTATVCTDATASGGNPIIKALKVVLNVLSYIAGIIAVIGLMVAGFRMVVGGGNSQQYNSSRNTILFVIVGIAVVVLSQTIVIFVLDKL